MKIPPDMDKWRTQFAWQMIGFAILSLFMAVAMVADIWFTRTKWLANPVKLFVPTMGVAFAAVVLVWLTFFCIEMSISTRRHAAKMKEMERNRPPLTLGQLREELQPEKQEQFRSKTLRLFDTMSPETKAYTEAKMRQLVERYRADLGSTPEIEADLAKLEVLIDDVIRQATRQNDLTMG